MKTFSKPLFALALALAGSQFAATAPAAAQAVKGIAVANPTAIVANSNAFKVAEQQRPVTYKAQIDRANQRKSQIEAQLGPLETKLQADAKAANPNQAALQQQYNQIQQIGAAGQDEINQILQPIALSRAYVVEQIQDKLPQAVKQAMAKRGVSLLLSNEDVVDADASYNLNQPILDELNTLIPNAQLVPPQGWVPRQQREQQAAAAQQAGQPAAAAPAQPAGKRPQGR